MSKSTMPTTEVSTENFDERNAYELAFHILPTVVEGEVNSVFDTLKAHITQMGEIFDEEKPERVELAYPIVKSAEGKNRKYASAYFGWVRLSLNADKVAELLEEINAMPEMLRSIMVKLTAFEEAHPYRFHENRKSHKMVEVVDEEVVGEVRTEDEEGGEVSDEALEESLEKIAHDEEVK